MSNKISNPFLKQLISGISKKANEGRINDISWGTLSEAKTSIKTEAGEKGDTEDPLAGVEGEEGDAGKDPLAGAEGDAGAEGEDPLAGAEGDAGAESDAGAEGEAGEDPDAIAADTVNKKAQIAANDSERKQTDKKLEKTKPYIELNSTNGIRFLLGKVLDQAFSTRTIDAFSKDMMTALNVKTKSDVSSFVTDHLQPFRTDKNLGKSIDELIKKMTADAKPDQETDATSSDESLG